MGIEVMDISRYLRFLFFLLVRLAVLILLGVNVRRKELLPKKGPAIIVANHNSHLDTLVLISLLPMRSLARIHPVAAADYFLTNRYLKWFATHIIGIIPVMRGAAGKDYDPLKLCGVALARGDIIILFPEGTRGAPEQISRFKKGIAYLAERFPSVPVTPVFMHGLGKALPKGDWILVPFFCDIFVGDHLRFESDKTAFLDKLNMQFQYLAAQGHFSVWD